MTKIEILPCSKVKWKNRIHVAYHIEQFVRWLVKHFVRPVRPAGRGQSTEMEDFGDDQMLDEIDQTLSCEGLFEEFSLLFSEIKENQSPLSIQNRLNALISRYLLVELFLSQNLCHRRAAFS